MRYTRLGTTDLEVSRICLGTWELGGGWGPTDADEARLAVSRALELGINFFDTASAYGWGASEAFLAEALGKTLRTHRSELVLVTKGGLRVDNDVVRRDSSATSLRRALEASLRSLRTDYVDVYLIHWPDPAIPMAESAGVLDGFVQEGLVRYVGASNVDVRQIEAFQAVRHLDVIQPPYSMVRRGWIADLLPTCEANGIGVMAYGPLAHGLLAGADIGRLSADDWRSMSHVFDGPDYDRVVEALPELGRIAAGAGLTLAQLAIAWTLRHPAITSTIVGGRRVRHVEMAAAAGEADPLNSVWTEVGALLAGLPDLDVASPEHP
jgi:aryl-alcohol dehydrogenase-like predicted oxidoreductase